MLYVLSRVIRTNEYLNLLTILFKEKIPSTSTTATATSSTIKRSLESTQALSTTAGKILGGYDFILIVI